MSKKKAAAAPTRVRPSIQKPRNTAAEIADLTSTTIAAMKASPNWASAADVQTAVGKWGPSASDITANTAAILSLKDQLHTAVQKQRTLHATWSRCLKQVLATVDAFCADSPVEIQSFGLTPVSTTAHPLLDVPSNIATSPGPLPGEVRLTWARGLAKSGFLVQHATDTTNPATMSPATACSKVKFTLAAPSGTHVFFRVAAIDPHSPTGQSPWSAWVSGTAM